MNFKIQNHCFKQVEYSGVSSFEHDGHLPFFSKKIRFLEPDDEIYKEDIEQEFCKKVFVINHN